MLVLQELQKKTAVIWSVVFAEVGQLAFADCPTTGSLAFDSFNHVRRLPSLRIFYCGEASGFGTAANFERFLSHDDILVGVKLQLAGGVPPACFSIPSQPTLEPEWATHAAQTLSRRAGCRISGMSAKGGTRTDIRAVE